MGYIALDAVPSLMTVDPMACAMIVWQNFTGPTKKSVTNAVK
jgi:hypothetical protein